MSGCPSIYDDVSKQRLWQGGMHLPRRKRLFKRLLFTTLFFIGARILQGFVKRASKPDLTDEHPIAVRMRLARSRWLKRVDGQTSSWHEFEKEYRRRYNMETPEGMYRWWFMAKRHSLPLIDEYDEMMESLQPFRQLSALEVRRRTLEISQLPTFSLLEATNGQITFYGQDASSGALHDHEDVGPGVFSARALRVLLERNIAFVPHDVIFAINEMPEPRIILPFATLSSSDADRQEGETLHFPGVGYNVGEKLWDLYAQSCPPETSARRGMNLITAFGQLSLTDQSHTEDLNGLGLRKRGLKPAPQEVIGHQKRRVPAYQTDIQDKHIPRIDTALPLWSMPFSTLKMNFDLSNRPSKEELELERLRTNDFGFTDLGIDAAIPTKSEFCNHTSVSRTSGAFYSDIRAFSKLYPVFSAAKMDGFADILVPNEIHAHLNKPAFVNPEDRVPWAARVPKLVWRGSAANGGNNPSRFQLQFARQRFVKMAQSMSALPVKLVVSFFGSQRMHLVKSTMNDLNRAWMDVAFDSLQGCGEPSTCAVTKSQYLVAESLTTHNMSRFKMAADLDATGLSNQFLPLLNSGTAVIRSSVYRDYASAWLEPWLHYIPLSLGYEELYNILAYFLPLPGSSGSSTHHKQKVADRALRTIAMAGLDWSDRVGGEISAELYMYRLALEWSRILNNGTKI